jgi:DNA-binding FadR family transcriptional regulator
MRILEPACAATCAERADRHATVLPKLRKVLDEGLAAIGDPNTFIGLARQFHTVLVTHCGNETMSLVIGSLEVLWSAQVDTLARSTSQHGSFADLAVRQSLADEHERIYRLIAEGDARGAEQAIREHYSAHAGERKHGFDIQAPISAARLKA